MSNVKVYLHTLPLGGFIRAVDEQDYLQACKVSAKHEAHTQDMVDRYRELLKERDRLKHALEKIANHEYAGIALADAQISIAREALKAAGGGE